MKSKLLIAVNLTVILSLSANINSTAQTVGISDVTFTPNTQAVLDLSSDRRGFLPPRMELNGNDLPISGSKPSGLMVYNQGGGIGPNGYYFWTGSAWTQVATVSGTVSGSGTVNYLPKFTPSGTVIGNSQLFDDGTNVGVGTNAAVAKLTVRDGQESATQSDFTGALNKAGVLISTDFTDNTYTPGIFWNSTNFQATKPKAGIYLHQSNAGSKMILGTSTEYANGIDNNGIVINDLGRVGINTFNPNLPLEVGHNGASTYGAAIMINQNAIGNSDGPKLQFRKTMTSTKDWSVGILNGVDVGTFTISENGGITGFGASQFAILPGGNVGIGSTTPGYRLDVAGGVRSQLTATVGTSTGMMSLEPQSTFHRLAFNELRLWDWNSGADMVTFNNGNMGVGNTNPQYTFHVDRATGDNRAVAQFASPGNNSWGQVLMLRTTGAGTDGAKLLFRNRDVKNWSIGGDGGGGNNFVITEDGGDGVYGSGFGNTRVTVKAGGNVGIGSTDPQQTLDVNGTIKGTAGTAVNTYLQNVHAIGLLQHSDGNNGNTPNTHHQAVLGDNGAWAGNYQRIYLRRSDNTYSNEIRVYAADITISDRKLKTNIEKIDDSQNEVYLKQLLETPIYHYNFINDPGHNEGYRHIGFMADDIPAEMQPANKDGVEIGDSFAMMLAGMKALQKQNDELRDTVKQLQAEMEELKQEKK